MSGDSSEPDVELGSKANSDIDHKKTGSNISVHSGSNRSESGRSMSGRSVSSRSMSNRSNRSIHPQVKKEFNIGSSEWTLYRSKQGLLRDVGRTAREDFDDRKSHSSRSTRSHKTSKTSSQRQPSQDQKQPSQDQRQSSKGRRSRRTNTMKSQILPGDKSYSRDKDLARKHQEHADAIQGLDDLIVSIGADSDAKDPKLNSFGSDDNDNNDDSKPTDEKTKK